MMGGRVEIFLLASCGLTYSFVCQPADDMEAVAIQLDDGRIGYICGETLLQAMSEDQDPLMANSKFVCPFPNCDKAYSTINHLKVTIFVMFLVLSAF